MNKSTCTIDKNGDKYWRNSKGELYRTDGPAIEFANGTEEYWYKDKRILKKKYYSKEFQVRMVMES